MLTREMQSMMMPAVPVIVISHIGVEIHVVLSASQLTSNLFQRTNFSI